MIPFKGDFAGGKFTGADKKKETRVVKDPGDLSRVVGEWNDGDAAPAVAAARKAFQGWASLGALERLEKLAPLKSALEKHADALAEIVTLEMGKVLEESRVEVKRVAARFESVANEEAALVSPVVKKAGVFDARLTFRPRGVAGILAPFNVPVHLALSPAISAMAAGNTVVVKPSELTPFTGQKIAEIAEEAGLPPGVFNLVQGAGEVGAALAAHADVDTLIFTGSWGTGRKVLEASEKVPGKLCALEMGGKNAAIVLKDADIDLAVAEIVEGAFMTSGQRCNSTSRVLVDRSVADKFTARFLEAAGRLVVGHGLDASSSLGPVASERGHKKVLASLLMAKAEGFEALRAGGPAEVKGKKGYYLAPSVHRASKNPTGMAAEGTYADDEVFGPDAAIYVVDGLDEAIVLNNRGLYGLVVSVFGARRADFDEAVRRAKNGLVNWNVSTSRSSASLPFGGLGRSGNARPVGLFSPFVTTFPTASLERPPKAP